MVTPTFRMRTQNLNTAAIVRQDERQIGLEPGADTERALAVLPVDFDPLLVREGERRPVDDDRVSLPKLRAAP